MTQAGASRSPQFYAFSVGMFTTEQMILGAGLLVLAFAIIYGLMLCGGHGKKVPVNKRK